MNGKVLDEVDQFKYLGFSHTKDGTSLKGEKIRLAGAGTLGYHKASSNMDKQSHQFSCKIILCKYK